MFNEDLDVFFSDFGEEVTFGTSKFLAIYDVPDELVSDFAITSQDSLLAKSSDVSSMLDGNTILFRGKTFVVKDVRRIADGAFSLVRIYEQ